jgi:phage-related protein
MSEKIGDPMKILLLFFPLMALLAPSCSQKQDEEEPDYENMVMADEEDTWISDAERDRKVIAGDLPDPQERIILESSEEPASE